LCNKIWTLKFKKACVVLCRDAQQASNFSEKQPERPIDRDQPGHRGGVSTRIHRLPQKRRGILGRDQENADDDPAPKFAGRD